MEIKGLNHVALLVSDVEQSRRFYGEVLGMEEVPRPSNFRFPGAWFREGGAELHLIGEAEEGRAREVQPGYRAGELTEGYCAHFALEVEDLEEAHRRAETKGVRIVGGPRRRGGGVLQMYLADPDGYVVELMAEDRSGSREEAPIRTRVRGEAS